MTDTTTSRTSLRIALFADVLCPWCWIGERRLRRALAEYPDLNVTVDWRPYQLNPHAPLDGEDWDDVVESKFGGRARATELWTYVQDAGLSDGVEFQFDRITRLPNSAKAHALVLFAAQSGRTWPVVDALFAANFREGQDIGDINTLLAIAAHAGLDTAETESALHDPQFAAQVQQSQHDATELGIQGVPFFVLDDRFGISGAQPLEIFHKGIATALAADR